VLKGSKQEIPNKSPHPMLQHLTRHTIILAPQYFGSNVIRSATESACGLAGLETLLENK